MVVMMVVPGVRHVETAFRAVTGLVLHLHGHMPDITFDSDHTRLYNPW